MADEFQYLFDSGGNWIAFRGAKYVFDTNRTWVGWRPRNYEDVVDVEG